MQISGQSNVYILPDRNRKIVYFAANMIPRKSNDTREKNVLLLTPQLSVSLPLSLLLSHFLTTPAKKVGKKKGKENGGKKYTRATYMKDYLLPARQRKRHKKS